MAIDSVFLLVTFFTKTWGGVYLWYYIKNRKYLIQKRSRAALEPNQEDKRQIKPGLNQDYFSIKSDS